jgi:peptidoglycan/xylan/chitin deacetylase (PgdA/CDA1 family)
VTCTFSLTFDDGPDADWTMRVLEALIRADVRATFFMIGERVRSNPAVARAVLEAGHEIELHCERHLRHSELCESEIERDTYAGLESLATVGAHPTLWRTPWGVCTEASERVAHTHGLRLVHWTIDTHDWGGDSAPAMLVAARPLVRAEGIVLMHDGLGPGALREGCANTVELIDGLALAARKESLEIMPLGEALQACAHLELAQGVAG